MSEWCETEPGVWERDYGAGLQGRVRRLDDGFIEAAMVLDGEVRLGEYGCLAQAQTACDSEADKRLAWADRLHNAILESYARQELLLLDGHLVAVRPGVDVPWAAVCPARRAVGQGQTRQAALEDLQEAIRVSENQLHQEPAAPGGEEPITCDSGACEWPVVEIEGVMWMLNPNSQEGRL